MSAAKRTSRATGGTTCVGASAVPRPGDEVYHQVFQRAPEAMLLVDGETSAVLDCNEALRRMIGCEPGDPPPARVDDLMPETATQVVLSGVGTAQTRWRRRDGREIEVLLSVSAVEVDGRMRQLWTARDNTTRDPQDVARARATEQALRESRHLLTLLTRRSPLGVILWNSDFSIREWNEAATAIFGYEPSEALGMNGQTIIPESVRPAMREVWEALLEARGGGERSLNENITKNGRVILCDWYNAPLVGEDGRVYGAVSMVEDITDDALARRQLARREEDFRLLSNAMPAMIAYVDATGIYRFCNQTYQRCLGKTRQEIVGHTIPEVLGEVVAANIADKVQSALAGRDIHYEHTLPTVIGSREMEVMYLSHTEGGMVAGFYVIALDVTARRAAERELAGYRDHLESLIKQRTAELEAQGARLRQAAQLASLGTLAAGLGHDMNNMLLPMRCAVDALEQSGDPDDQRPHVAALRRSLEFLAQLAAGLLTLASAPDDAARGPRRTNLAQWWARDGAMLAAAARSVELKIDLPARLPDIAIAADQLSRAVLNLVVNAAEATGRGGTVQIWAREEQRNNDASPRLVAVAVTDNGPGMPPEVQKHALEPFFTTKKRGFSTGLGLSLVHAVAQSVGGTVRIDAATGQGTTVFMLIPQAGVADTEQPARLNVSGPRTARVSVSDDRVAGYIIALLEARGIPAARGAVDSGPGESAIWVTEPTQEALRQCGSGNPSNRKVIVVGSASCEWQGTGAILIEDPTDIAGIAAALR